MFRPRQARASVESKNPYDMDNEDSLAELETAIARHVTDLPQKATVIQNASARFISIITNHHDVVLKAVDAKLAALKAQLYTDSDLGLLKSADPFLKSLQPSLMLEAKEVAEKTAAEVLADIVTIFNNPDSPALLVLATIGTIGYNIVPSLKILPSSDAKESCNALHTLHYRENPVKSKIEGIKKRLITKLEGQPRRGLTDLPGIVDNEETKLSREPYLRGRNMDRVQVKSTANAEEIFQTKVPVRSGPSTHTLNFLATIIAIGCARTGDEILKDYLAMYAALVTRLGNHAMHEVTWVGQEGFGIEYKPKDYGHYFSGIEGFNEKFSYLVNSVESKHSHSARINIASFS
jgi:hypothetical protein